MRTNIYEKQYREEINTNKDYRIDRKGLCDFFHSMPNKYKEDFTKRVDTIANTEDLYYIAVDYSLPVILVKWVIKLRGKVNYKAIVSRA